MRLLNWNYDRLRDHLQRWPEPPSPLNPLILAFLNTRRGSKIIAIGRYSVSLQLSPDICAKVSLKAGDASFAAEQEVHEETEWLMCTHLMQYYLIKPDVIFFEMPAGTNLHERIDMLHHDRPVKAWMVQLLRALSVAHRKGHVHGAVSPDNILVDELDRLRLLCLTDLYRPGDPINEGLEPYVRMAFVPDSGIFGPAGRRSEFFAVGTVLWYMSRGDQLFDEYVPMARSGRLSVTLRNRKVYPLLGGSLVDRFIRVCWWEEGWEHMEDAYSEARACAKFACSDCEAPDPPLILQRKRQCYEFYRQAVETLPAPLEVVAELPEAGTVMLEGGEA